MWKIKSLHDSISNYTDSLTTRQVCGVWNAHTIFELEIDPISMKLRQGDKYDGKPLQP